MSFANLPVLWGLLGLGAIASVLYLLQRLRVRHQPVEVETTLFWRQAIEQSRARVLVQRFRHPWAYMLVLAIAALLWLGFAGLRSDGGGTRDHLVLVDGSAAMAVGQRFADATRLAVVHASSLPEDARTVVLCAGRPATLLRPGEQVLLLSHRLATRGPEACPNSIAAVLRSFAARVGDRPLSVCIVGDAVIDEQELAMLPATIEVQQYKVAIDTVANRGIVALGVRAAASGQWQAVDVLVEVAAVGDEGAAVVPTVTLDGASWQPPPAAEPVVGGQRYRLVDVPARGQLLEVALPGDDALTLDDRASFRLPERRPIAVAIGPGVPPVVQQVVAADPGLQVQQQDAQAVIRIEGSGFGGALPAIELTDPERSEDAFLVFHPEQLDPGSVLDELYTGLGLNEIDAMATAKALGRAISMGARPAPQKQLWLWRQLLREDYDFVRSRSFPLFFGLGVRWLVDFEAGPVRVAVGEPVAVRDQDVAFVDGGVSRSFGEEFVPIAAGHYTAASGSRFAASLLDPLASGLASRRASPALVDLPDATTATAGSLDLVTVVLLLALLLLGTEWVLYRTGRIP